VVINKIDKPAARPEEVHEMVYELFLDLGANDEQLKFKTVYASSRDGVAKLHLNDKSENLNPLLDVILKNVPLASTPEMAEKPLSAQPFNLAYDNFLGRCAICRIYSGKIKYDQGVVVKNLEKEPRKFKIVKLFTFNGLNRQEVDEAVAGDIVMIAGLTDIEIGETIVENINQELLPAIKIDEPTISLNFLVNNSPFAGKEGKFVTGRQIKERLKKELEVNVGLKIDFSHLHYSKVFGRGELHIAILLENLRREGYELQVSKPQVIIKEENGKKLEPFEEVLIDIPEKFSGTVIEKLSKRKGQLINVKNKNKQTRLTFRIPTRGLLGYRSEFIIDTKGTGILCAHFLGFDSYVGDISGKELGSMISMITGKAAGFALWNLQERGVIYIGHGENVYEGMIIGNTPTGYDMEVNPAKGKQLTNMRASGSDEAICLTPPWEITLERGLSIINDDEYMEVTPKSIRLRKQHLTENERKKAKR
jgi:GTP-binding protein